MLIQKWDWERYAATQREEGREEGKKEGREEGREEGRKEGRAEMLADIVRKLSSSMQPDVIASSLKLPIQQVQAILSATP